MQKLHAKTLKQKKSLEIYEDIKALFFAHITK
jgi:hypothetical protein